MAEAEQKHCAAASQCPLCVYVCVQAPVMGYQCNADINQQLVSTKTLN